MGKGKLDQEVVASVFDYELYYSDIPEDLRKAATPQDSAALVNGFVDQWVRKMLLLHEAEKRIPESLDIDKLVQDYHQSLLINNLEKQVILEELDTIITKSELENLYATIKGNYIQEYPVIRIRYIKIPEKAPQIDRFYEWWKKDNVSRMKQYGEKYGTTYLGSENSWFEWEELKILLDESVTKRYNFKKAREIQKNIGDFEYFINIYEFVDQGEIAPLGIIEDQVKNIIIQKRKTSVMNDYLERTFQRELNKKNIVLKNK